MRSVGPNCLLSSIPRPYNKVEQGSVDVVAERKDPDSPGHEFPINKGELCLPCITQLTCCPKLLLAIYSSPLPFIYSLNAIHMINTSSYKAGPSPTHLFFFLLYTSSWEPLVVV